MPLDSLKCSRCSFAQKFSFENRDGIVTVRFWCDRQKAVIDLITYEKCPGVLDLSCRGRLIVGGVLEVSGNEHHI